MESISDISMRADGDTIFIHPSGEVLAALHHLHSIKSCPCGLHLTELTKVE